MGMTGASDSSDPTMSEINVTPLVDVMLVLLIIFMITAPLMQQGVEIDLPQTQADILDTKDQDLFLLSLTKDRKIYIGKTEIPREKLETILEFNDKLKKDKKIDFAADRSLDYGFVVDVMAALRRAGIEQVGMLTEPPPPEKE
jgi:biopolymer transport protein TolR